VPKQGKIICIGLNYRRHAAESGERFKPPVLFSKFNNTVAASGEDTASASQSMIMRPSGGGHQAALPLRGKADVGGFSPATLSVRGAADAHFAVAAGKQ
jgi:hypothetical protein